MCYLMTFYCFAVLKNEITVKPKTAVFPGGLPASQKFQTFDFVGAFVHRFVGLLLLLLLLLFWLYYKPDDKNTI